MNTCLKLLVLAGAVLTASGCAKKDEKGALPDERHTVSKVSLRDVISQTGEVRPIVKVELKSEASGKIEQLFIKEGQRVSRGDKILRVDPLSLNTKKAKLDLSAEEAKIRLDLAQRDYDQAKELASTGTISNKQLQDLKSQLDLRTIAYKQQMLELDDINDQLSKTVLKSPMTGVITVLDVEEGEVVTSATSGFQAGTVVGTVADISRLEVVTQIGEVDYIHLKSGQKVIIKPQAVEGSETRGTISFISLSAKKSGELSTFEVRITIDSIIPGIAPGINVNVDFVIMERTDVTGVPYHFINKRGKGATVLVASTENGKEVVKPQRVRIGATDYKHYEILEGLKEGDVVVFRQNTGENGQAGQPGQQNQQRRSGPPAGGAGGRR